MEDKPYRPKRCAMWYAPGVLCIGTTRSYTENFCLNHYTHYLISKGESWVDKVPLEEKIVANVPYVAHTTEFYDRAREVQLSRRKKTDYWYADDPQKVRYFNKGLKSYGQ